MDLYPLRFEPLYQYRLWGGRRLERYSRGPLPVEGPVGEAWLLSDRDDHASTVAEGPLRGKTLRALFAESGDEMLGSQAGQFERYPLLLKFLDASEMLSVQVHPSDAQGDLLPKGERGKTESWLVMEAGAGSSIYAGLAPGVTPETMRAKSADGTVEEDLASFAPKVGDGLFIEAGTVHALGGGVMVFETQQNSDVTFRLFDWNRVDTQTGKPRELHVEKAIRATNFEAVAVPPTQPTVLGDAAGLARGDVPVRVLHRRAADRGGVVHRRRAERDARPRRAHRRRDDAVLRRPLRGAAGGRVRAARVGGGVGVQARREGRTRRGRRPGPVLSLFRAVAGGSMSGSREDAKAQRETGEAS